jgi:hypothetical protein
MLLFQRFLFLIFAVCVSCSSSDEAQNHRLSTLQQKGEYIYRKHDEVFFTIPAPLKNTPEPYPWEKGLVGNHPKITKEFFRCKGSHLNPVHVVQQKGETQRYFDCGGAEKHSLPLRENKEFIYAILIDLLNYIQAKTGKRVVITCGHRCPTHHVYADSSTENQYSKHMIGAEVNFYVQGMEEKPEALIQYIQDYYKESPTYKGLKEYTEFKRYEKDDTNVSIAPWMNKEVFIKLFKKKEGRNFDNRHPYSYISIQVRYDREKDQKVVYSWDQANHNYLRK